MLSCVLFGFHILGFHFLSTLNVANCTSGSTLQSCPLSCLVFIFWDSCNGFHLFCSNTSLLFAISRKYGFHVNMGFHFSGFWFCWGKFHHHHPVCQFYLKYELLTLLLWSPPLSLRFWLFLSDSFVVTLKATYWRPLYNAIKPHPQGFREEDFDVFVAAWNALQNNPEVFNYKSSVVASEAYHRALKPSS